ncbi:hypothetical protein BC829DRAFT_432223 [Chytridium lagenaria]|nr:hypothetical protein BC829DRAFT_432223 [Chytridium lagenaria]
MLQLLMLLLLLHVMKVRVLLHFLEASCLKLKRFWDRKYCDDEEGATMEESLRRVAGDAGVSNVRGRGIASSPVVVVVIVVVVVEVVAVAVDVLLLLPDAWSLLLFFDYSAGSWMDPAVTESVYRGQLKKLGKERRAD